MPPERLRRHHERPRLRLALDTVRWARRAGLISTTRENLTQSTSSRPHANATVSVSADHPTFHGFLTSTFRPSSRTSSKGLKGSAYRHAFNSVTFVIPTSLPQPAREVQQRSRYWPSKSTN